jgi:hypothetical protein
MRKCRDTGCSFVAAYCEGFGLAAVAVICGPKGVRIAAAAGDKGRLDETETMPARFWCRVAEAEHVAAAAARLVRKESSDAARAAMAVPQVARKLGVALFSEGEIAAEAHNVAARIEAELQNQQANGGLKSANQAYRGYRLETSARGERVLRYDEWMLKYKENLVRQVAASLR